MYIVIVDGTIRLYQDLTERLNTLPGVKGIGLSNPALLSGSVNGTALFVANGHLYHERYDAGFGKIDVLDGSVGLRHDHAEREIDAFEMRLDSGKDVLRKRIENTIFGLRHRALLPFGGSAVASLSL